VKFDTSSEAHEFIESVFRVSVHVTRRLWTGALFALGEGVPASLNQRSKGVTLNDEQVVGDELRIWSISLNHRTGRSFDEGGIAGSSVF
jgi:hypothetical protein